MNSEKEFSGKYLAMIKRLLESRSHFKDYINKRITLKDYWEFIKYE